MDRAASETVRSEDGTVIAFERVGTGPALILVDGAGHYRELSSFAGLIGLLATDFTVYHYDRRGRGGSTDTPPYAVEREIDDLAAIIDRAGESAFLYTSSSGGLLALRAAAGGLPIRKMALFEPPIELAEDRSAQAAFTSGLIELVATRPPADAVEYFLSGIGVPDEIIAGMRNTHSWSAMEAAAHTLVYDSLISESTSVELLASVNVPTLVLDSGGSSDELIGMATTVAKTLPHGSHKSVPGDWHGVPGDVLAPVLTDFFKH